MLVSIIVITYNSERYVLETLESAYRQSYPNIELIVSDDCSTDNTLALCEQWIAEHQARFVRTVCTQTSRNGGIVYNYNHAIGLAQGEWIKYIAGDDILCHNCIDILVRNIRPSICLYFSSLYCWDTANGQAILWETAIPNAPWYRQLHCVLRHLPSAHGATLFVKRTHLIACGGFEASYPLSEDFPIVFRTLSLKHAIGIINIPTVVWRLHTGNTSRTNQSFFPCVYDALAYYAKKYCWRMGLPFHQYHYFTRLYIRKHFAKGGFRRRLGYLLRAIDLVHWKRKIFPIKEFHLRTIKTLPFSQDLVMNCEYDYNS